MSIDKNYTVGYSADGQFIKIPKNPSHKVGQIINYQPTITSLRKPWGMAVAAAILLVFHRTFKSIFYRRSCRRLFKYGANYRKLGNMD